MQQAHVNDCSIGGNCLTKMIATISTEKPNKYESISTCRFAQRVAMVNNEAHRNEIMDDKALIKKLRERIAQLQVSNSILSSQPAYTAHR